MFRVDRRERPYQAPWADSLAERVTQLRSQPVRVAYLYEQADASTFRYRAYNMQRHINDGNGRASATYFFAAEVDTLAAELGELSALIVCRYRYDHRLADIVALARARGVKVLFDIDDYVFDPTVAHLVLNTLDYDAENPHNWDFWFGYIARLEAALLLADGAIATTRYLADLIAARTAKPVVVIPNFLNDEQIRVSDELFKEKAASGYARDRHFDIGYFSGSPSHQRDFELARPALVQLLADDPDTRLFTVGYLNIADLRRRFPRQVNHGKMTNFVRLQRLIAGVEVNIVPLQDNVFTNAKSELKFFEAALVGTVTIATGTYAYAKAIDHGRNGFIANNGEWYERIRDVRSGMASYPGWAAAARADALANHSGPAITAAITAMLESFGVL